MWQAGNWRLAIVNKTRKMNSAGSGGVVKLTEGLGQLGCVTGSCGSGSGSHSGRLHNSQVRKFHLSAKKQEFQYLGYSTPTHSSL